MIKELIHTVFEDIAEQYPTKTAVEEDNCNITYQQLNKQANRIAHLILSLNISSGTHVAVILPSGVHLVSTLLGCLKAGVVYLPLSRNTGAPAHHIFHQTNPGFIITESDHLPALESMLSTLSGTMPPLLVFPSSMHGLLKGLDLQDMGIISAVEEPAMLWEWDNGKYLRTDISLDDQQFTDPGLAIDKQSDAYIFFTSGSTGISKGIIGSYKSLAHYIHWHRGAFNVNENTRISQLAPVTFDASLKDILVAITAGATLHVPATGLKEQSDLLATWLHEKDITLLQTVPSIFRLITKSLKENGRDLPSLEQVVLAGEKLYGKDVLNWRQVNGEKTRLTNMYGLTETTILKSCYHIQSWNWDPGETIPVGTPISNSMIAVVNQDQICAPGEIGDIYIKSPFMTKGYLDTSLNSRLFVQNPLVSDRQDIVCYTGDIGRYREDGNLELLGRRDEQIKLHGVRVELDAVKAVALKQEGIEQVELLLHTNDEFQQELICYYSGKQYEPAALRALLEVTLPKEYLPAYYIWLAAFPLNINGKVDRKKLPRPWELLEDDNYEAPLPGVETQLLKIWQRILGNEKISRHASFFVSGGSSLKAIQLVSRIYREMEVQLSIADVFNATSIAAQAELIYATGKHLQPLITPVAQQSHYGLSHGQRRLWVLEQLHDKLVAYSRPDAYRLQGKINVEALEQAFIAVIKRHESLRTGFIAVDGEPRQVIIPADAVKWNIAYTDLRAIAEQEQQLDEILSGETQVHFNLSAAPLIRVSVVQLAEEEYVLIHALHHIISDEWSMQVLIREVLSVYNDPALVLPELTFQYKDYAAWQATQLSGANLKKHADYWLSQLQGELPVLELPTDYERPAVKSYKGAQVAVSLPAALTSRLKALAEGEGGTLFMGLVSLVKTLLYRYSGQDDIITGIPVTGRSGAGLEQQIGFYLNTLPLRSHINGEHGFVTLLQQIKEQALALYAHEVYPFDLLVDQLQLQRDMSRSPVFDVAIIYREEQTTQQEPEMQGVQVSQIGMPVHTSLYDLTFWFSHTGDIVKLILEYNTDVFAVQRITNACDHLLQLLDSVLTDSNQPLNKISYLSKQESEWIQQQLTGTQLSYPADSTLIALFEEQVRQTPAQKALVIGNEVWSYHDLNVRANQLANYLLQQHKIAPGDVIALKTDRNEWLLPGILGILKTGAAYLPVDPSLPEARIAFMLKDSDTRVILTDRQEDEEDCTTVYMPEVLKAPYTLLVDNPPIAANGDSLAYMMYTSGSTGTPKGVLVPNKAVINLLYSMTAMLEVKDSDSLLAVTTYSFDISVLELFLPLLNGATVILAENETVNSPLLLQEMIRIQQPTIMQATPSLWSLLFEHGWNGHSGMKLLSGGEALGRTLAGQLLGAAAEVWNVYGPTETTIWSAAHKVTTADAAIPLGRPVANTTIYLLDDQGLPVPAGVPGNLLIGGAGLSDGYWKRPALTTEKFIKVPLVANGLLYRTGDKCAIGFDGMLYFSGREDEQVKIRGYRVETGEIAEQINQYKGILQSVAVLKTVDAEQQLVAYFVASDKIDIASLRTYLATFLPAYMMPAAFVQMEQLPVNANGKIDRKALPLPEMHDAREYIAPVTKEERTIAAIWQEILGVDTLSVTDNFFHLGGHSLKAIQVIARIYRDLQIRVGLKDLFHYPVLSAFAAVVRNADHSSYAHIPEVLPQEYYPLSHAQRRLWLLHQLEGNAVLYNLPMSYYFNGVLNEAALNDAFSALLARHESLRTRFVMRDDNPVQEIISVEHLAFRIVREDLREEEDVRKAAEARALELALLPFELSDAPLLRVHLLQTADQECLFFLCIHHIIADEWSIRLLIRELLYYYNSFQHENITPLPALRIHYKDYASWQLEALNDAQLTLHRQYWKEQLSGPLPKLELPSDRLRPVVQHYSGGQIIYHFNQEGTAGLDGLCRQEQATRFILLTTLVKTLLFRYSGQEDIIVGTPVAGREHTDLENQIGYYLNILPLRSYPGGRTTFRQYLRELRETAFNAYTHQAYPFDMLVDELGLKRDISRAPLFDIVITLENAAEDLYPEMNDIEISEVVLHPELSKVDLHFIFRETSEGLYLKLEYSRELYDEDRMLRMMQHLESLMIAVARDPETELAKLNILPEAERAQILSIFNNTTFDYPRNITLVDLFEAKVKQSPDAVALMSGDKSMTYAVLNEKANRLAKVLRHQHGIESGTPVGVMAGQQEWLVIAILGVLKAGGAYVPIDVSYPAERISYIIEDTSLPLLITISDYLLDVTYFTGQLLVADIEIPELPVSEGDLPAVSGPSDLAYIIYTSGSTGKPKGVMVKHAGVVNMVQNELSVFGTTTTDRVLQFASPSFDASVAEIFMAFAAGATLVLIPAALGRDATRVTEYMEAAGVTVVILPVSYLTALDITKLHFLRKVITAGDVAHVPTAVACAAFADYYNCYGPTEATVWASSYQVTAADAGQGRLPIGKPVHNVRMYILDELQQLLPVGISGEICIGGAGVAAGYYNNEILSTAKFIKDPYGAGFLYRTGDTGRWLADGNIDFTGRLDDQVKIRGYRIETGEVEQALLSYPGVSAAVVKAFGSDADKYLAAYYTATGNIAGASLRTHLQQFLPEYMLPSYFVQVEQFRMNNSGKIDRKALKAPQADSQVAVEKPVTATEAVLLEIWKEILGNEQLGTKHHFFDAGGHSLKGIQVVTRVYKQLGIRIELKDLFLYPVLSDLAAEIDRTQAGSYTPISTVAAQTHYKLSHAQRRLWVLDQFEPEGSIAYNLPVAYRLEGKLDLNALATAFHTLIERHESLRTVFEVVEGVPMQRIQTVAESGFELQLEDLRGNLQAEEQARDKAMQLALEPFDLKNGPLLKAKLMQTADEVFLFVLSMHHIISDERSLRVILEELIAVYNSTLTGTSFSLPVLKGQYKDYAAWQEMELSGERVQQHRTYWLNRFEGDIPVLDLPADHPRPPVQTYNGGQVYIKLPEALSNGLKKLASSEGASLFMGLVTLVKALLYRYTGQEDIIIGSPAAGREHPDLEHQIGFFINTLVLRSRFDGKESFRRLLQQVKQTALEAYSHQVYPFDTLVDELDLERDMSRAPLFDVVVVLDNTSEQPLPAMPGLNVEDALVQLPVSKIDLRFFFTDTASGIGLTLEYNSDLYNRDRIQRMTSHLEQLLIGVLASPEKSLQTFEILSDVEQELLTSFNHTTVVFPAKDTLVALFEEQVRLHPDAIALEGPGWNCSYHTLNERANQLARLLLDTHQVKKGDIAAIMPGRNEWQIIGLLGALKAGLAYLPIDSKLPKDRIRFMLEDAGAKILLTESAFMFDIDYFSGSLVVMDIELYNADLPVENPETETGANDLAYVIYTSGSTGQPKGVKINHSSAVNMVFNQQHVLSVSREDKVLLFSSFSFDGAVFETFMAICSGGVLVIPEEDTLKNAEKLLDYITATGVTAAVFPSAFAAMLPPERLAVLRFMITAGDVAPVETLLKASAYTTCYNGYGPTENTVCTTLYKVSKTDRGRRSLPIGRPVGNVQVYVLNAAAAIQPVGIDGELCIAGVGLSAGYLDRQALTADKFIANPFGTGLLYRTGDKGRWLPDGNLQFSGRIDNQVKIRGFRIEKDEIAQALSLFPGIDGVAVVVRQLAGDKYLVAYYAAENAIDGLLLRQFLGRSLPEYMIPSRFIHLAALPLNNSGKISYRHLPVPVDQPVAAEETGGTVTEQRLLAIWKDILQRGDIGFSSDFFLSGGHSLKAIQLITRIYRDFSIQLSIGDIFGNTVLASLAALIDQTQQQQFREIPVAPEAAYYPLSHAQQRLWLQALRLKDVQAFNGIEVYRITGHLRRDVLEAAFAGVVERHESLRTVFVTREGTPMQQVVAADFRITYEDLQGIQQQEEVIITHIRQAGEWKFSLDHGPLIRVLLLQTGTEEHVLLLTLHHIIADEWSMQVLIKDLLISYNAGVKGAVNPLKPLRIQYKDYTLWQAQELSNERLTDHEQYWLKQLGGTLPQLTLPADRPRPAAPSFSGEQLTFRFSEESSALLRQYVKANHATLFMGLLSLVKALLYRYSGERDIIIGTPVAGRDHADLEDQIGYYLNTLALRTHVDGNAGFYALLQQVKQTATDAFEHQVYPFDRLVEMLGAGEDVSRNPVFDVVMILQNIRLEPLASLEMEGVEILPLPGELKTSKGDLRFLFAEEEGYISGNIEYSTDLFNRERIEQIIKDLQALLILVLQSPEAPVSSLAYREDASWQVASFNAAIIAPVYPFLTDVITAQALQQRNKTAIKDGEDAISYEELTARYTMLAAHLEQRTPVQSTVAVALKAGITQVSSLLACFKAGMIYLPMDAGMPVQQLIYILKEATPAILITDREQVSAWETILQQSGHTAEILVPAELEATNTVASAQVTSNMSAYIYYTSGSTGMPKGIVGSQGSISHYAHWHAAAFNIGVNDNISQLAPVTFDASLKDIFPALMTGATLHIPSPAIRPQMDLLAAWLSDNNITILQTVPSLFRLITASLQKPLPAIRQVVLAGERLYGRDVINWRTIHGATASISNLYGLTETTVLKTCYHIPETEITPGAVIPVGYPITHTAIAVLNNNHYCQEGEIGEVYISSPFVTKGYLSPVHKDIFVTHPFVENVQVVRTGDLGRYLPGGLLELLGRKDEQVKLHGVRVETAGVRSAILEQEGITQTELVLHEEQELICYYTGRHYEAEELRKALATILPQSHLPSAYIWLEVFPMNINGKVDRKRLPRPELVLASRQRELPHAGIERLVADIWEQILGTTDVGRAESFFTMGGSSLKAIQLLSRIYKMCEVQLSIADVFEYPTVAGQARLILGALKTAYLAIPHVAEAADYALSYAQQRLWVLEEQMEGQATFNIFMSYLLEGSVHRALLQQAFTTLVLRHESLRTVFVLNNGVPRQKILTQANISIQYEDLRAATDKEEIVEEYKKQVALSPFDLREGPLMRVVLLHCDEEEYVLLFAIHHIVADEWSLQILVREVLNLYNNYVASTEVVLPSLPLQYKDYAHWQSAAMESVRLKAQRSYWLAKLGGTLPVLELPVDRPRPAVQTYNGQQYLFEWSPEISNSWRSFLEAQHVTMFMGLLSLVKLLLFRYSGQQDIIVGTPVAGRDHPDLEGQIGYYLNTLALRSNINGESGFNTLLSAVKQTSLEAFDNQLYPFDRLVEELGVNRDLSRSPLFDVVLILQNVQVEAIALPEMANVLITPAAMDPGISKGDLRFQFEDQGTHINGSIEYNTDIYDRARITRMLLHLQQLMVAVMAQPELPLTTLNYLTEEEREEERLQSDMFSATIDKGF
ncbi:non-ribosomal peptide synthetase [Chitinophaga ginsengisoli]|uniref:Amino acid adenylation domain-containing protein n=1 Tax=Chitinophaga ginsengisoli TaxID=363837 RepID=A0A2P8G7U0_9BACT|nr:non-ribosomal peptide synthetase [Chitinophaga ginsengisoli]PSL30051.1 amino acid adenylation domain-containing protein [Chitinophaga ginsengisoli]